MSEIKTNHICKNINCSNGEEGGRKHYFACDYCGKTQNWRSMACSLDCYNEYMKQIVISRKNNISVGLYPERTDMSYSEIVTMIEDTPMDEIKESTIKSLSDYADDIETVGLGNTIDKINQEIDGKKFKKKHK